jgi:hypothetical protein
MFFFAKEPKGLLLIIAPKVTKGASLDSLSPGSHQLATAHLRNSSQASALRHLLSSQTFSVRDAVSSW